MTKHILNETNWMLYPCSLRVPFKLLNTDQVGDGINCEVYGEIYHWWIFLNVQRTVTSPNAYSFDLNFRKHSYFSYPVNLNLEKFEINIK